MPGHQEGELRIGTDRSAIGTLVEHSTRFTMLIHLPRMEGLGVEPRVRTAQPWLATAPGDAQCLPTQMTAMPEMPEQLRRSLTWG